MPVSDYQIAAKPSFVYRIDMLNGRGDFEFIIYDDFPDDFAVLGGRGWDCVTVNDIVKHIGENLSYKESRVHIIQCNNDVYLDVLDQLKLIKAL